MRRRRDDARSAATLARRRCRNCVSVSLLASLVAVAARSDAADDIAWFRIKDVDGTLLSRQLYDQVDGGRQRGVATAQRQYDRRNEIDLHALAYVYHPNLLTLDVSAGPVFQQSSFRARTLTTTLDNSQTLVDYDLAARADVLRAKPYRGTLYYDRSHPTLLVGFGETATSDNREFGATFDLLEPVTPLPFHLDVSRRDNTTDGSTRDSRDRTDRLRARVSHDIADLGSSTLDFNLASQQASSVNPGLARQSAQLDSAMLNLRTSLDFGARRQHTVTQRVDYTHQAQQLSLGTVPDRDDLRFALDYRGSHDERLRSFANYRHDSSWRSDLDQHGDRAGIGINFAPDGDWLLNAGLRGERERATRFASDLAGVDAGARYQHALPLGLATLTYNLRLDLRRQRQRADAFDIIGESIVLAGLAEVTLGNPRVRAGSVVVSDANRTRTFIEGVDYQLLVVGIETRLRRLAGGAILDDEPLLVDYSVELGGSYASVEHAHGYAATWQVVPGVELQYRGQLSDITVTAGEPGFPLNEVRADLFALRADYPVPGYFGLAVGGNLEYEKRDATFESYTRDHVELFARTPLPWLARSGLRLGVRRTGIDSAIDAGDADLRALDFNLSSQFGALLGVSLDASYEEDVGGVQPRRRMLAALRANGRYRRLELRGELVFTRERQGVFERDRLHALLELRRAFF